MPSPHGLDVADQTERFLLRYAPEEAEFLRLRAAEEHTSINLALRGIIREAMPPADPRAHVLDLIRAHRLECPLCPECPTYDPRCTEGRKLDAAYQATIEPTPPPAPRKKTKAGRRPLGTGMDPVEPVKGQVPFPEGDDSK